MTATKLRLAMAVMEPAGNQRSVTCARNSV